MPPDESSSATGGAELERGYRSLAVRAEHDGPCDDCRDKIGAAESSEPPGVAIRKANELGDYMKAEALRILNDPTVEPRRFTETEFFARRLYLELLQGKHGRRLVNEPLPRNVPTNVVSALEKHFGRKRSEIRRADLLSLRECSPRHDRPYHRGQSPAGEAGDARGRVRGGQEELRDESAEAPPYHRVLDEESGRVAGSRHVMHIDWFFGPDGHGFVLDSEGQPQSSVATPFHGIVGLGLRDLLFREGVPPDAWVNNAHLIFDEQVERAVTAELAMLRAYADECEALSFGDSAVAVRTYLEERWGDLAARAEAWNVKEGHTSSVWNVMLDEQAEEPREFALNIGRDKAAGAGALAATSGRMREIKARCSDIKMAAVLDIRSVRLMRRRGTVDVVVTQNEWVGDSCEIHALGNGGPSSGQYLAYRSRRPTWCQPGSCLFTAAGAPTTSGRRSREIWRASGMSPARRAWMRRSSTSLMEMRSGTAPEPSWSRSPSEPAMSDYIVTVPNGAQSFNHDGATYNSGDQFASDDACQVLAFYQSFNATNPTGGRTDGTPAFWQNIEAACPAGAGAAPPAAQLGPADESPAPPGSDSPGDQGAPEVPASTSGTETNASPPGTGDDASTAEEPTRPPAGEPDPIARASNRKCR